MYKGQDYIIDHIHRSKLRSTSLRSGYYLSLVLKLRPSGFGIKSPLWLVNLW